LKSFPTACNFIFEEHDIQIHIFPLEVAFRFEILTNSFLMVFADEAMFHYWPLCQQKDIIAASVLRTFSPTSLGQGKEQDGN